MKFMPADDIWILVLGLATQCTVLNFRGLWLSIPSWHTKLSSTVHYRVLAVISRACIDDS